MGAAHQVPGGGGSVTHHDLEVQDGDCCGWSDGNGGRMISK